MTTKTKRNGPVVHRHVGGWVGGPGECGARCACGVIFDGFDTPAEASALLDRHIADAPCQYLRWRTLANRVGPRRAKNRVARRSRRINRLRGA